MQVRQIFRRASGLRYRRYGFPDTASCGRRYRQPRSGYFKGLVDGAGATDFGLLFWVRSRISGLRWPRGRVVLRGYLSE